MTESIKIVLLGETAVGKTSIIQRFITDSFNSNCISSLSAQFNSKTMEINGETLKIDIWDTAGQEKYRSLARIFYKDAKVIVFVYDITSQPTFEGMKNYWYEQTKINCEKEVIFAVVANKNDLYAEQQVPDEEGEKFADDIGAIFQSTSAQSDTGIGQLFDNIGRKLIDPDYDYKDSDKKAMANFNSKLKKEKEKENNSDGKVKLDASNSNNKKGGCCS